MDSKTTEHWVVISGWEDYEVSNLGRIRSIERLIINSNGHKRIYKSQLLKPILNGPWDNPKSRLHVRLYKDKKGKSLKLHKLVAANFELEGEGPLVLHKDGDRFNNSAANLKYGTSSENTLDAVAHRTNANSLKTKCLRGHLLIGSNLIESESSRRNGNRSCRSCSNAKSYILYHKMPAHDLERISDMYYEKYMESGIYDF